jgi:peptidylprolyl isomerase domain and WD repeat-containing protein 1
VGFSFESKVETDLYEFAKNKTQPLNITLSPRGDVFATMAEDRKIRLFRILTGKLITVIDESLQHYSELQQVQYLPSTGQEDPTLPDPHRQIDHSHR